MAGAALGAEVAAAAPGKQLPGRDAAGPQQRPRAAGAPGHGKLQLALLHALRK